MPTKMMKGSTSLPSLVATARERGKTARTVVLTSVGVAAISVAKWNGSSWSALGSGMNLSVRALAVSRTNLYAGGYFTTAGGAEARNVAKWNGSSWNPLGSGIHWFSEDNAWVSALAVSGTDLYAGGGFPGAGSVDANNIAKWDGDNWSALGSGVTAPVYALAVSETGGDLYAGGAFKIAGNKVAGFAARAILRPPLLTLKLATPGTAAVSWPSSSPGFGLQQNSGDLNSGEWTDITNSILDDGTNNVMTQPIGTSRFFRLVLP